MKNTQKQQRQKNDFSKITADKKIDASKIEALGGWPPVFVSKKAGWKKGKDGKWVKK